VQDSARQIEPLQLPARERGRARVTARRQADNAERRLLLADQRQAENERLARGLLPRLAVGERGVASATRYRPGGQDALLGGDFFDAVQLADGTVRAVIGDVCGHGPDEAAVGVALRIAWRALVLSGLSASEVLRGTDRVLRHERPDPYTFATVCDLTVAPDGRRAGVRRHGHHPPLLVAPVVGWMDATAPAPPLGSFDHADATPSEVALPDGWAVLLTTDGLHEARSGDARVGEAGLVEAVATIGGWAEDPGRAMDELLEWVTEADRTHLVDDVALLWLGATRP
jgi:serine phosphatase RsbU (regulator of sigma subunit)